MSEVFYIEFAIKFVQPKCITNCLRVIHNAWHFHYALVLVFKVVCGSFSIALLTPSLGVMWLSVKIDSFELNQLV